MSNAQSASEARMISAFLGKGREERWEEVLARPKGRKKFLARLCHEKEISRECMIPIPHLQRFAPAVYDRLRKLGAPDSCHVISDNSSIDGKDMPLLNALEQVVDRLSGTTIVCVPNRLGYYFSEERNGQYILLASNQRHDR
jgi:hypothetical protein